MVKRNHLALGIGVFALASAIVLFISGKSPFPAIGLGVIAAFVGFVLWEMPKRHKVFSDSDRLKATSRAMGGSGPPELWLPDIPQLRHEREKGKRKKRR